MSTKELQLKYAAVSSRQAINRAIRAELRDGSAIIDNVETYAVEFDDRPTFANRQRLLDASRRKLAAENVIRQRYGIPQR